MLERILFIGGEQDGIYNLVRKTKEKVVIPIYTKFDFKKFFGIVTVNIQPVRTEVYYRKRIDDIEYFCLEGMSENQILSKLSR